MFRNIQVMTFQTCQQILLQNHRRESVYLDGLLSLYLHCETLGRVIH